MKIGLLLTIAPLLIGTLFSGCVLGSAQSLPAIDLVCTVLDDRSGAPIRYAEIFIVYAAPNPGEKNISHGPFVTGADGSCRVSIPVKTMWISGSDAFIGGYHRSLTVKAPGFHEGGIAEGYNRGALKNSGDYTFRLKPE